MTAPPILTRALAVMLFVGMGLSGYNLGRAVEHRQHQGVNAADIGIAKDGHNPCPPGHHLVQTWNPDEEAEGKWKCEEPTCAVRVHPFDGVTCESVDGLLKCSCTPATEEVRQLRELKQIADDGTAACWKQRDAMLEVAACNAAWKVNP